MTAAVAALALVTVYVRSANPLEWFAHSAAPGNREGHSAVDADEHDHQDAEHHDAEHHEHPGHRDETAIKLSPQAQRNIGMQLMKIAPRAFERTITVPAVIVERPGRSEVAVTAALSGIVRKIYPLEGQAVVPGEPLFDLRLTHEELVQGQTEFLRTAEELDIVNREIARLEPLAEKGAIAIKTILDRRYEREKLMAVQRAQRQGLLLHGLSAEQIDQILKTRTLQQGLTISVPQGRD
ncbi:MAG TPA: efflux RND transporter periplasmic adaptor subunit, partial [Pirellulales bacterium]